MANKFQLVARSGPTAGQVYPLESAELSIGRDLSNEIVINDPEVSRRHARLFLQGNTYVLEDLGSTNGTSVNGQRLVGPYILKSNEVVTLGEAINLVFEGEQPEEDLDATWVSGGGNVAATRAVSPAVEAYTPPPPQPKPVQPEQPAPYAPPSYAAEDVYAATPQAPEPYMPPAYAGQVPNQPPIYETPQKKKFPVAILVIVILLIILCICVAGVVIIDQFNLYCDLFGFVFNAISPGTCP